MTDMKKAVLEGKASKRRRPSFKHLGDEVLLFIRQVFKEWWIVQEQEGKSRESGDRDTACQEANLELSVDKDSYISEDEDEHV